MKEEELRKALKRLHDVGMASEDPPFEYSEEGKKYKVLGYTVFSKEFALEELGLSEEYEKLSMADVFKSGAKNDKSLEYITKAANLINADLKNVESTSRMVSNLLNHLHASHSLEEGASRGLFTCSVKDDPSRVQCIKSFFKDGVVKDSVSIHFVQKQVDTPEGFKEYVVPKEALENLMLFFMSTKGDKKFERYEIEL